MTVENTTGTGTTTPTRRSFLAGLVAAGALALFLLGAPGYAQAPGNNLLSTHPRAADRDTAIRPFRVNVPEADLVDLRRRIAATRWPDKETVSDESQGIRLAEMQPLVNYWGNGYNWRNVEAKLNALPEFVTTIDGVDIQFIHVRSREPNALPLILTHGWPGSPLEFMKVIGPLTDPVAYGGSAQDAFDVVIPAIPAMAFRQAHRPRLESGPRGAGLGRAHEALGIHPLRVGGWRSRLGHFRRARAPGAAWAARHPYHDARHDSPEPGGGHQ